MKAIVYERYGPPDVLQLKEVEKPVPKDNEVLVKIHAASINYMDWGFLRGEPLLVRLWSGLFEPKNRILGADIAGQIEAAGENVKEFQTGDEVFGDISGCGHGGFAEYAAVPDNLLVLKSAGISFEEAAAVPVAAITALQGIRKGQIQPGQKVLINGASGGVGTYAVQIAKSFGTEVTAVCSTTKLDMARSIGADFCIDYTKEDFTQSGQCYDLIVAANGYHSISDYKRALTPEGTLVVTGGSMAQVFQSMFLGPLISSIGSKKVMNMGVAKPNKEDLTFLKELLESGKVKPILDRCYTLNEVPDALRYFGEGHARGKVVITVPSRRRTFS
ncbi:MAG: zinc-binding dehydrogenase [Candidatus Latescibacteria bacterium]|nr:zinc-binding dehydrogenase [Candidatus Latescibacterota bacterium]NIO56258.1 zinc-binding dehydrogenase [Candidatus Latescibacterota bacterium]